jgi:hypothetical protein
VATEVLAVLLVPVRSWCAPVTADGLALLSGLARLYDMNAAIMQLARVNY